MNVPTKIPHQFDDLPEPSRSKALEFYKELLEDGANPEAAVEQAHERAQQWIAERAPAAH